MIIEPVTIANIFSNLMLFSIVFSTLFLIMAIFFIIGWKLAGYKNRRQFRWALIISVSGFYGIIILAALDKIEKQ